MALSIKKGENIIVRYNLKQKDGTPLLLASVTSIVAEVIQNGTVIETLTYPSANIRQGTSTSQLEIEVIRATSDKFTAGDVSVRTTIVAGDSDFDTELVQKKIDERIVAKVKK